MLRIIGRICSTRVGANSGRSSRRNLMWSGASSASGIRGPAGSSSAGTAICRLEKVLASRITAKTSSYRVQIQYSYFSFHATGHSSRSRAYSGYGSSVSAGSPRGSSWAAHSAMDLVLTRPGSDASSAVIMADSYHGKDVVVN